MPPNLTVGVSIPLELTSSFTRRERRNESLGNTAISKESQELETLLLKVDTDISRDWFKRNEGDQR